MATTKEVCEARSRARVEARTVKRHDAGIQMSGIAVAVSRVKPGDRILGSDTVEEFDDANLAKISQNAEPGELIIGLRNILAQRGIDIANANSQSANVRLTGIEEPVDVVIGDESSGEHATRPHIYISSILRPRSITANQVVTRPKPSLVIGNPGAISGSMARKSNAKARSGTKSDIGTKR